jgi:hypothetical protein
LTISFVSPLAMSMYFSEIRLLLDCIILEGEKPVKF